MKLKKYITISLLVFGMAAKSHACGPYYYDPQDYLMYRGYENQPLSLYNFGSKENCALWQEQTSQTIKSNDIYRLVYKTSSYTIRNIVSHNPSVDSLRRANTFAAWLWDDREAAEFLLLAKECEEARSHLNSPWYYPASKQEKQSGLYAIADRAASYTNERFLGRYTLQRIRALFSLREYDECLNCWDAVSERLEDNILKQMCERYIGGTYYKLGDKDAAREHFLRAGDIEAVLMCEEDDATPRNELLFRYAPDCWELRDWISREIHEKDRLTKYEDFLKSGALEPKDRTECLKLAEFCARVISGGKVSNPDFWYYSKAYLLFLAGDKEEAMKAVDIASESPGTQEIKDNIRVFRIYLNSILKPWSDSYEAEMISELKWLDSMIVRHIDEVRTETIEFGIHHLGINVSFYYWNDMMRKVVFSSIVPKLLENHREVSAIRFSNMADNRLLNIVGKVDTWCLAGDNWISAEMTLEQYRAKAYRNYHDYRNQFFRLIDNLDVEHLIAYVKSLDKAVSREDLFLDCRGYTERAFFYEIIGTKMLREMRYSDAAAWLSMVPKGFQERLNTYKAGFLMYDPFAQSKQPMKDRQNYKLRFALAMTDLEGRILKEKDPTAKAKLLVRYATGMRNSVAFCWALTFHRHSTDEPDGYSNNDYFEKKQDAVLERSEKLFAQALAICKDKETAAMLQYYLGNMKTVAELYPESKAAANIRGACDKLVDYHLEGRKIVDERQYGFGPYPFEEYAGRVFKSNGSQ